MKITVDAFQGEAPRVTPRKLPQNAAQVATNCRMQTGDLESWRQFALTRTLANTGPVQTVYLLKDAWLSWNDQVDVARGVIPGDITYRTFLTSPGLYLTPRYTTYALATSGAQPYPTATRPLGVPGPTVAPTYAVGVDTTPTTYSIDVTDLGASLATDWSTNPPLTGATYASVTQGAGIYRTTFDENRNPGQEAYAYRDFGTANATSLNVSVDVKFVGDTSVRQACIIVGASLIGAGVGVVYENGKLSIRKPEVWGVQFNMTMVAEVAVSPVLAAGTVYSLRASVAKNSTGTKTVTATIYNGATQLVSLTATNDFLDGDYCGFANGISSDGTPQYGTEYDNYHVIATGSTGYTPVNIATSYVYTFVNGLGEESAPSPASTTVLRPDGVAVTVTTPTTTPLGTDPDYGIVSKRLYRAVTGSTGTVFTRVATIPLATADFIDNLADAATGPQVLESEDWDLPPPTLQGILALPNGIMVGFFANQLCFSARQRPHAWPVSYRLTTDTDIVAIANIDNTVVIGTKSYVYTATGNDPASYSMSQPGDAQACVSKRSMVYVPDLGVAFASPDGYIVCSGSAGATRNATEALFTKRQWQALTPESIIAGVHDGVLHFFYSGTDPDSGYALDFKPGGFGVIRLGYHATAMHTDPLTDGLYLVLDAFSQPTHPLLFPGSAEIVPNGLRLYQFDAGAEDMVYLWRGRLVLTPYPLTLTIAQVQAGDFRNLVLRILANGRPILEKRITDEREFTFKARDAYDTYEIEIIGTSTVRGVQVAEDVMELT